MWRACFLLFAAPILWANEIEINVCTYSIQKGAQGESGPQIVNPESDPEQPPVFELRDPGSGRLDLSISDKNYTSSYLRQATKNDLISSPPHLNFSKRIRFIIDNNGKSSLSDKFIARFEETTLIDSARQIYTINYYALNQNEFHKKYGITKSGIDLNDIDDRGDAKMIVGEKDDYFTYLIFNFKNADSIRLHSPNFRLYDGMVSRYKAPFVYIVQYQNLSGEKIVFDRISQDEEFTIPVVQEKMNDSIPGKEQNFRVDLICQLMPQEYKNGKLETSLLLTSRLEVFDKNPGGDIKGETKLVKSIEFENDHPNQIKFTDEWLGKIYKRNDQYAFGDQKESDGWQVVFEPNVGDQYITIRPIKTQ